MVFIHDTGQSLAAAVYLVNTLPGLRRRRHPADAGRPRPYLAVEPLHRRDPRASTRSSRPCAASARACARCGTSTARMPCRSSTRCCATATRSPSSSIHDGYDWHIHATVGRRARWPRGSSSRRRWRSSTSSAPTSTTGCGSARPTTATRVYIDYSRNGSKRYCDTGNCGNRMNVNAYRRRKARETA